MPQCLKDAGYATAIIGKCHLGHADTKFWPKQRGFDYQYGAMIGELDYYTHSDAGVLNWFRNNKAVTEKGYKTQLIGSADKPFYLYLTFNAPHTPYQAPQTTWTASRTSPIPRSPRSPVSPPPSASRLMA